MNTSRPWFWSLKADGHGPDWIFHAVFSDAEALAAAVREHMPGAFVRDVDFRDAGAKGCVTYVDRHTHERLVQMRAAGEKAPIWYSGEISVEGATLLVRHVMSADLYDETALIVALAQRAGLGLGRWRVGYGGDFFGDVAQGEGAEGLLGYLGLDADCSNDLPRE